VPTMPIIKKESLERLRSRIDLPVLLESYIELKRAGASFKALCPFHDEKTPSFTVQKGDSHYHCFGCGAHGDAIEFLMQKEGLNFTEAVELLADKFQVFLEYEEVGSGPVESKRPLYELMQAAHEFFHTLLLESMEARGAREYLEARGVTTDFLKTFEIGFSLRQSGPLSRYLMKKGFTVEQMSQVGLLRLSDRGARDFFSERILFPIRDGRGRVIGFSGRKYIESTFGGKYINTPETPLFKKSRVLFGLNYSRARIAKERRAILVEGQMDALRLISSGLNLTVAAGGTAFGEGHVEELLRLGVHQVYLAFDSDQAGYDAALKVGHLFQSAGVEVAVLPIAQGEDPDSIVQERGVEAFVDLIEKALPFLEFFISRLSARFSVDSPAGKNEIIRLATQQIRGWNQPVIVHESLKKLALLMQVPEDFVVHLPAQQQTVYKKAERTGSELKFDPDHILESDLLRLLLLIDRSEEEGLYEQVFEKVDRQTFENSDTRELFTLLKERLSDETPPSWMELATALPEESQPLLDHLQKKRINNEKVGDHLKETVHKILERKWLREMEKISQEIQNPGKTEERELELVKAFDEHKRNRPTSVW